MRAFVFGLLVGMGLAAVGALYRVEPAIRVRNGTLAGWSVVRDDETLLCEDPVVFVRARQIECP